MDVTEDKPHAPEEVEHEAEDAHEVSSSHEAPSSRTSDGSGSPSQKKGGLFRIENGFKSAFTATGKFFKTTKDKVSESKFGEKMKEAGKKGKAFSHQVLTSARDGKVAKKLQRFGDDVSGKMHVLFKGEMVTKPVFGVTLRHYQLRHPGRVFPYFFESALEYLKTEGVAHKGLFVAPIDPSLPLALQRAIDVNEAATDLSKSGEPVLVSALVRQYLRDMPEPLFGFKGSEKLVALAREEATLDDGSVSIERYASILTELAPAHRAMIRLFLSTLFAIQEQSAVNGIVFDELAIALGPLVIRPKSRIALFLGEHMVYIARVLKNLILHHEEVLSKVPTKGEDAPIPPSGKEEEEAVSSEAVSSAAVPSAPTINEEEDPQLAWAK